MKSLFLTVAFMATGMLCAQESKPTSEGEASKRESDTVKTKTNVLDEVKITNNKKFIKVESDKTTVSVKDNPMLSTGNAYDAVKKLPGVIASPNGGLTLNGRGITIYVDGAPSTLSGTDLENYLTSLPANAFDKVELIYNPGAAYDANSSGSVINLVSSNRRMKGINASFNINYNFNKYQKPSPQILLNGKEKRLSWQTMIGYNYIDREQLLKTEQTFTAFNPVKKLNQENFVVTTNRNFYWRTGTNYKLSDKSNLLFNYNLNLGNDREVFENRTSGESIDFFNSGTTKEKNNNHEISLQYKSKLDSLGTTLDVIAFGNLFDRNPKTISSSNSNTFNNSDNNFDLKNYYLKYDLTFPFEKKQFSITTGGKYNILDVDNIGNYYTNNGNSNIVFDYSESNLAFYVEARKKIKKFGFTAGLRYEDFRIERISNTLAGKIEFKNQNLFPNLSAIYELNDNVNVSASYSKKINQPNYNNLDPNNSNRFDQYNTSQGNPFLNPSFFDNYEFKISAMQFIQVGVNYTASKDSNKMVFNADPNATELISNQTFQQFERFNTVSAFLNFPIPIDYFLRSKEEFQKRMGNLETMNYIYVSLNYIKNDIKGFAFPFENKSIWTIATESQFILPYGIKSYVSYFILPKGNWEIYKINKPIQQLDLSINKDFMGKKLKVGLHCFDVFNTHTIDAVVPGQNLQTSFYKKDDTRNFRISLTYNFGNLKLEKENTEIQTEKVQTGGGLMK